MTSVWVVAESRFEWYEIKHICATREKAIVLWEKLRDELIKENEYMVKYCMKEKCSPEPWLSSITLLHNMKPDDSPSCDYPDLVEWTVEE